MKISILGNKNCLEVKIVLQIEFVSVIFIDFYSSRWCFFSWNFSMCQKMKESHKRDLKREVRRHASLQRWYIDTFAVDARVALTRPSPSLSPLRFSSFDFGYMCTPLDALWVTARRIFLIIRELFRRPPPSPIHIYIYRYMSAYYVPFSRATRIAISAEITFFNSFHCTCWTMTCKEILCNEQFAALIVKIRLHASLLLSSLFLSMFCDACRKIQPQWKWLKLAKK